MGIDRLFTDCRFAVRSMAKHPLVSAVAILSLAAGIGCTTATLTLRNAIFYNSPALYQTPGELSFIGVLTPQRRDPHGIPAELYRQWAARRDLLTGIAAATAPRITDIRTSDSTQDAMLSSVSP